MTYDPKTRMNDDPKEAANASNMNDGKSDTELAADTWMGAVLNPDVSKSTDPNKSNDVNKSNDPNKSNDTSMSTEQGNDRIAYDPYTMTESYQSGNTSDDGSAAQASSGQGQMQANTGNAGGYQEDKPVVKRMIVDDNVADWESGTKYEVAAEVSPTYAEIKPRSPVSEPTTENNPGGGMGLTALGLSILSLFLFPYLLAPIGMIVGYLAMRRGARTLGIWAMVIGAIAILGAMVIYPYFVAR
ncbi:MFS transporter [Brevibacillus migulae]|uniref:DUF4190 domain-containing protein n=1 Tax=Brevibacillus migulae TaxID=1644114 RepID=UPI00106E2BF4|nr:DUF4190 domain-containing protein [Brevibacillus migulae]